MRCWASFAASAILALACATPAAAAPATSDFARATNAFLDARRAAAPRAVAAVERRGAALAADCLDVFKAAPPANRELLGVAYELDLEAAALGIEEPLYRRLLDRLERTQLRSEPELMRARRLLRTEVAFFGLSRLTFEDACATARAWQAAGWRTPPRSIQIFHRLATLSDAADEDLGPASRLLARTGHRRAARAVLDDFVPADSLIERPRDPIRCALGLEDCGG